MSDAANPPGLQRQERRVAVMQPYLFAYLGYFQLISAADEFVLFDDVQYIKRGWVNRNNILCDGASRPFTLPVRGASRTKDFNGVCFESQERFVALLQSCYGRAPCYRDVGALVQRILKFPDRRVARLVHYSLTEILGYIGMCRPVSLASEVGISPALRGQDRVLAICSAKGATAYINPAGGRDLYDRAAFARAGVRLLLLHSDQVTYPQFADPFIPQLSIIDALMFNSPNTVNDFASRYMLEAP